MTATLDILQIRGIGETAGSLYAKMALAAASGDLDTAAELHKAANKLVRRLNKHVRACTAAEPTMPAQDRPTTAPAKPKTERCTSCASRSGHYQGCDRNRWTLPKLTQPKPGTAAHVTLTASIMRRIAAIKVNPETGYIESLA